MIKFLLIIIILGVLFYVITYPYISKFRRKVTRALSFEEVAHIQNYDFDYSKVTKQDIDEALEIEKRVLKSNGNIKEELEYVLIKNREEVKKDYPCLILLHGLRDRAEDWIEKAHLLENYLILLKERLITKTNIILINSGDNGMGWYTNFYKNDDAKYESYITQELLPLLKKEFPNSSFGIAGFSMGGYGAFKLGLKHLDIFKVIGSFSGAISIVRMSVNRRVIRIFNFLYIPKFLFRDEDKGHFLDVFGSWGYKILREDPYTIIKKLPQEAYKDRYFYTSVGENDFETHLMFQQWLDTVGRMKKHGYNFKGNLCKYETHTWDYVARDLKNFLLYFNEKIKD